MNLIKKILIKGIPIQKASLIQIQENTVPIIPRKQPYVLEFGSH